MDSTRYPPSMVGLERLLADTLLFYRNYKVLYEAPGQLKIQVRFHWLIALTLGLYRYFAVRKLRKLLPEWAPVGVTVEVE